MSANFSIRTLEDDASLGRFSYYIPGIGTYFRDIGDDGGTTWGLGFGHMGQARLDWAFEKFDEAISRAEARAQNPTKSALNNAGTRAVACFPGDCRWFELQD